MTRGAPVARPRVAGPASTAASVRILLAPRWLACGSVAVALVVAIGVPARAADLRDLVAAFGNTIVSTHPDGRQAKLLLNRDFTYSAQGRQGQRSGGDWKLDSGKVCLTQRQPYPIPFSYCKALPHVAVGSSWSDTAVTGETVTNRVVAGR